MRFNPLADDPMTMPAAEPAPAPTPKPRRTRKPAATPSNPPAPAPTASPLATALSKVPGATLEFLAKGSPLEGIPADELRRRTLAHAATSTGNTDWRRAFASMIEACKPLVVASEPAQPSAPEPARPASRSNELSMVQVWRGRLTGFMARPPIPA